MKEKKGVKEYLSYKQDTHISIPEGLFESQSHGVPLLLFFEVLSLKKKKSHSHIETSKET